jgi:periplasmic protein TonB
MRSLVINPAYHDLLSWGLSATLHVAAGVALVQWAGSPPIGLWQQSVAEGQAVTLLASIAAEDSAAEEPVTIEAPRVQEPVAEPLPVETRAARLPPSPVGIVPAAAQSLLPEQEPSPNTGIERAKTADALPVPHAPEHNLSSPSRSSSASVATSATVAGARDDIPRQLSSNAPPVYPPEAIAANWEGSVLVQALVSAEGSVLRASVARSSGIAILDAAALQAVKQWRFSPARKQDRAVDHEVLLPIRFRIDRG